MRWAWAKILTLIGAGIAAVFAAGSAQGPAFVQAYLQRLGGHIDEARRTVFELREGAMSRAVPDDTARDRLLEAFTPAMPLDPTSLIYAAIGLVIGWAFWELVQWPVRARLRKRRQRRLLAR
jgi:hypothetical protein